MTNILILCECDSWDCAKSVHLPLNMAFALQKLGYVVIANGCPQGPKQTDTLLEECGGYKVYRPQAG